MTDKEQIIIHGIDVSKCKFYRPGSFPTDCEINPVNAYCESPTSSNCYFKQLARKTQEYEQKEKELLSNEKIINKLMKEVDELKQECDTLKSQLDFTVQQKECFEQLCEALKSEGFTRESLITEQENEIDELRQKYKELKEKLRELELKNMTLQNRNQQLDGVITECDCYRKVLKKTEKYCIDQNLKYDYTAWKILDIINKAKGM